MFEKGMRKFYRNFVETPTKFIGEFYVVKVKKKKRGGWNSGMDACDLNSCLSPYVNAAPSGSLCSDLEQRITV